MPGGFVGWALTSSGFQIPKNGPGESQNRGEMATETLLECIYGVNAKASPERAFCGPSGRGPAASTLDVADCASQAAATTAGRRCVRLSTVGFTIAAISFQLILINSRCVPALKVISSCSAKLESAYTGMS